MRTTMHNGRSKNGRGYGEKHNDRNFDVSKADNINAEKMKDNIYRNYYNDNSMTFEQVELRFYEENFEKMLSKINANYIKNRHAERVKTMEDWKRMRQNAPEEMHLQIGKLEEHATRQQLIDVYTDYRKWLEDWNEQHGKPFTVLTEALHCDEAVHHYQVRRVWHYRDKNDDLRIGQERALKTAGVELPNPGAKESRRNNRKITFDKMCREKWLDICHKHGIEVEREPIPNGRHNREKEDMIRDKYEQLLNDIEKLQIELNDRKQDLWISPALQNIKQKTKKSLMYKDYVLIQKDALELVLKSAEKLVAVRNVLIDTNTAYASQNAEFERLRDSERYLRSRLQQEQSKANQHASKAKDYDKLIMLLRNEGLDIERLLQQADQLHEQQRKQKNKSRSR